MGICDSHIVTYYTALPSLPYGWLLFELLPSVYQEDLSESMWTV